MKRKKVYIILLIIIFILLLIISIIINNKKINVTKFEYYNDLIPESFNNYSIVQLSDLHNEEFGQNNTDLITIVKEINPDLIAMTGDMIDSKKNDINIVLDLVNELKNIAPIYFVSGNHEATIDYDNMVEKLTESGVTVLNNEMELITLKDECIEIIGLNDLAFLPNEPYLGNMALENTESVLKEYIDSNNFQLLLSHRPEIFDTYVENNIELVLSGHAHGGQIRIPLIGGLIAPDQGFFPKYDAGIFEENDTTMYVSRGLGNSVIPFRINNNPEIVNIILKTSN